MSEPESGKEQDPNLEGNSKSYIGPGSAFNRTLKEKRLGQKTKGQREKTKKGGPILIQLKVGVVMQGITNSDLAGKMV